MLKAVLGRGREGRRQGKRRGEVWIQTFSSKDLQPAEALPVIARQHFKAHLLLTERVVLRTESLEQGDSENKELARNMKPVIKENAPFKSTFNFETENSSSWKDPRKSLSSTSSFYK